MLLYYTHYFRIFCDFIVQRQGQILFITLNRTDTHTRQSPMEMRIVCASICVNVQKVNICSMLYTVHNVLRLLLPVV